MKIKCGWCDEEIEVSVVKTINGYGQLRCPDCNRIIPSSKVIREDGKHWHRGYKSGDIA